MQPPQESFKQAIKQQWQAGLKHIRHSLFPPICLFCKTPLNNPKDGCCTDCLMQIKPVSPHQCQSCGSPLPQALAPGPCGQCLQKSPVQASTQSLFQYQGAVRDALLAWKLQGQDAALAWLIQTAAQRLQSIIQPHDLLIPIPMPLQRMRQQGRHHAADLCQSIAAVTHSRWDWRILRRQGKQQRQSALNAKQRLKNLRKAFVVDADYWQEIESVTGRVWLIDDIITTGMTVHYAAKVMRPYCQDVHVLSLTRTTKG